MAFNDPPNFEEIPESAFFNSPAYPDLGTFDVVGGWQGVTPNGHALPPSDTILDWNAPVLWPSDPTTNESGFWSTLGGAIIDPVTPMFNTANSVGGKVNDAVNSVGGRAAGALDSVGGAISRTFDEINSAAGNFAGAAAGGVLAGGLGILLVAGVLVYALVSSGSHKTLVRKVVKAI